MKHNVIKKKHSQILKEIRLDFRIGNNYNGDYVISDTDLIYISQE